VGHRALTSFRVDKLRKRREAAGLSLRKAAELAGVSTTAWAAWERGRYAPRPDRLAAVAAAVGCQPADLVGAAKTLADYRILAGLNRPQLAARLGVTQQTVAQWEAGEMPVAPGRAADLASALDIDAAGLAAATLRARGSPA